MSKIFADRAFLTVNGFELAHLKTANLSVSEGLSRVSTMTRNRRDAGYKHANKSIQIDAELEIEANRAQVDLALANPTADIRVVYEAGGERYIATGVAQSSMDLRGSVGDASKSLKLEALDCTNENGTPVNTGISLG